MTTMRLDEALAPTSAETSPAPKTMRLGDAASMAPVRVPAATDAGNGFFFEITPEMKAQWDSRGKIGFFEQWQRQDKTEMLPFVGTAETGIKLFDLMTSMDRLKKGMDPEAGVPQDQLAEDAQKVTKFLMAAEEESHRGYSIGGRVAQGVAVLPGFAVEFLATGGAAALGKAAVKETAKKALGEAVEKGALGFATRSAAVLGGATMRTAAMPQRVIKSYAERQMEANLTLSDKGVEIARQAHEKPFTSTMKAFGDVLIENFSEVTGEYMTRAARVALPKPMIAGLTAIFKKLHPNEAVSNLWTRAGYNGLLAEIGEERLGDFLRALTGVEDFGADNPHSVMDRVLASIPNAEELLVEGLVFSVPGALNMGTGAAVDLIRKRKKEGKVAEPVLKDLTPAQIEKLSMLEDVEKAKKELVAKADKKVTPDDKKNEVKKTEPIPEKDAELKEKLFFNVHSTPQSEIDEAIRKLLAREPIDVFRSAAEDIKSGDRVTPFESVAKEYGFKGPTRKITVDSADLLLESDSGHLVYAPKAEPEDATEVVLNWLPSITGLEDWASAKKGKRYAEYKGWFIEDTGFVDTITPIRYHIHDSSGRVTTTVATPQEAVERIDEYLMAAADDMEFKKNRELKEAAKEGKLIRKVGETFTDASNWLEDKLTPISSQLTRISKKLGARLKKFEAQVHQHIFEDQNAIIPFLQAVSKMEEGDRLDFDLALKNSNQKVVDALVKKYDMQEAFDARTKVLEGIRDRAVQVGFEFEELENYHPRAVKDVVGFLQFIRGLKEWTLFDEAVRNKEKEVGRMDDQQIASYINSLLRLNREDDIRLAKPGALKERTIKKINAELNQFYHDSSTALLRHVYTVNTAIAARKFFGKAGKGSVSMDNVDGSIGQLVMDLLSKSEISGEQAITLSNILKDRFNERGTSDFVGLLKNLSYIDIMGNPISAVTQIQDVAFSLYKNGYYRTARAILRQGKQLKKEDIFLSTQAQEFADSRQSAQAVKKVFKAVGFEMADNFGKSTFINAAYERLQSAAKAGNKDFLEQLDLLFENEAADVAADLKAGRVTENVKILLFSELSDVQPISLSEMPPAYNRGGDARVLYMLKSYTLKQLDLYRRDVIDKGLNGDPVGALRNLASLSSALMLMGVGADGIKDLLLGRDFDLSDTVVKNIWKIMGFSRYMADQAAMKGPGRAFLESSIPPVRVLDSLFMDVLKGRRPEDWESIRSIPAGGELFYWWFGGGRTKLEEKRQNGKSRNSAP